MKFSAVHEKLNSLYRNSGTGLNFGLNFQTPSCKIGRFVIKQIM